MNSKLQAILDTLSVDETNELTYHLLMRLAKEADPQRSVLLSVMTTAECVELANLITALQSVFTANCPIVQEPLKLSLFQRMKQFFKWQ